jgi:hypothetical protein
MLRIPISALVMSCLGHAALHELFPLDNESKVGTQGHVEDRTINYQQEYDDLFVYKKAYGPFFHSNPSRVGQ